MAEPVNVDMSKGGIVTLILGSGYEPPTEFAFDPRVFVVDANKVNPRNEGWIPSTTRLVIFTDRVPDRVRKVNGYSISPNSEVSRRPWGP
jgi:hypothetical protein